MVRQHFFNGGHKRKPGGFQSFDQQNIHHFDQETVAQPFILQDSDILGLLHVKGRLIPGEHRREMIE
ncbi:hypothetical protein U27_03198 [Candidatus Vecturithrix granuli]|uniref:Uncharacterized protein n=1 Tax=Vecturithrix granuli TaxID=1499967 RepID=A0A081BV81_VECG1|nr:hypothetical protein U27_03198 [Candidatus Vecturithrix granuli]